MASASLAVAVAPATAAATKHALNQSGRIRARGQVSVDTT